MQGAQSAVCINHNSSWSCDRIQIGVPCSRIRLNGDQRLVQGLASICTCSLPVHTYPVALDVGDTDILLVAGCCPGLISLYAVSVNPEPDGGPDIMIGPWPVLVPASDPLLISLVWGISPLQYNGAGDMPGLCG